HDFMFCQRIRRQGQSLCKDSKGRCFDVELAKNTLCIAVPVRGIEGRDICFTRTPEHRAYLTQTRPAGTVGDTVCRTPLHCAKPETVSRSQTSYLQTPRRRSCGISIRMRTSLGRADIALESSLELHIGKARFQFLSTEPELVRIAPVLKVCRH